MSASPASTDTQIEALERQLQGLSAALDGRVAGAQMETLQHLQLLHTAAEGLEVRAAETALRRNQLLLAAKRLAMELRGLDLLADHVKAVDVLSRKLEAQVAEVVAAGRSMPLSRPSAQY